MTYSDEERQTLLNAMCCHNALQWLMVANLLGFGFCCVGIQAPLSLFSFGPVLAWWVFLIVLQLANISAVVWTCCRVPVPRMARGCGFVLAALPFTGLLGLLMVQNAVRNFLDRAGLPFGFFGANKANARRLQNQCVGCGYSLEQLESGVCPECGLPNQPGRARNERARKSTSVRCRSASGAD